MGSSLVTGIIDLEELEKSNLYSMYPNLRNIVETSVRMYKGCLFEKNKKGEIETVFEIARPENVPDTSTLGAITKIMFGAIEGKPLVERNEFSNFALYNTPAKISYVPREEYNKYYKILCDDLNVPMPSYYTPKSKKKKSTCNLL